MALRALLYDLTANSSSSSRLRLYSRATISEVKPILKYQSGFVLATSGLGTKRHPPMLIIDMVSAPPAIITSAIPADTFADAMAIDSIPDEQKRLMVEPGTSTVSNDINDKRRPMFIPDSASGKALPTTMSSISDFSICGKSSNNRLITVAAMSSGRVKRKVPLGALPMAERYPPTIYAFIILFFTLVKQSEG